MAAYLLLADSAIEPEAKTGSIVYDLMRPDYGLASADSRGFGYECVSVTLSPYGDYPSFTVPKSALRKLSDMSSTALKHFDLSNLLKHAFMAGRGKIPPKGGMIPLSDEDIAAWTQYDPLDVPAFARISMAINNFKYMPSDDTKRLALHLIGKDAHKAHVTPTFDLITPLNDPPDEDKLLLGRFETLDGDVPPLLWQLALLFLRDILAAEKKKD